MTEYTPIEPNSERLHFRTKKKLNDHVIRHVLNRNEKWKNVFAPKKLLRIRQDLENGLNPMDSKYFQTVANRYEKIISLIAYDACMEGKNHTHSIEERLKREPNGFVTDRVRQYIHVFDPQKDIIIIISATIKESKEKASSSTSLKYRVNTAYRLTKRAMTGSNNKSYVKSKLLQSSLNHPNCTLIADHR